VVNKLVNNFTGTLIKNRVFTLVYRCMFIAACSVGLILNFFIRQGRFDSLSLIYYTNQSNLLCVIYFAALVVCMVPHLRDDANVILLPRVKGALTLMITVTMLVYHFLLAGNLPASEKIHFYRWLSNTLLHYVAPAMVILDWILFDLKRAFKLFDPLIWLLIPLVYAIFTMIRAEIGRVMSGGSRFPYFFLDIDAIGWNGVLFYVGVFAVAFTALGYIIYFLDRYAFDKPH